MHPSDEWPLDPSLACFLAVFVEYTEIYILGASPLSFVTLWRRHKRRGRLRLGRLSQVYSDYTYVDEQFTCASVDLRMSRKSLRGQFPRVVSDRFEGIYPWGDGWEISVKLSLPSRSAFTRIQLERLRALFEGNELSGMNENIGVGGGID